MRFRLLILASMILIALPGYGQDGMWKANVPAPQGDQEMTFNFEVDGDSLTGSVNSEFTGEAEIQDGSIDGDKISFKHAVTRGQRTLTLAYTGTFTDGEIELTRTIEGGGGRGGRGGRGGWWRSRWRWWRQARRWHGRRSDVHPHTRRIEEKSGNECQGVPPWAPAGFERRMGREILCQSSSFPRVAMGRPPRHAFLTFASEIQLQVELHDAAGIARPVFPERIPAQVAVAFLEASFESIQPQYPLIRVQVVDTAAQHGPIDDRWAVSALAIEFP